VRRAWWRVNLGSAEFPQGEFTSPKDVESWGPRETMFRGGQGQAGQLDLQAPGLKMTLLPDFILRYKKFKNKKQTGT